MVWPWLRRGAACELGLVPVDERIGELPLQAYQLAPVRFELVAVGAAVAHRLALRDERADRVLEAAKIVGRGRMSALRPGDAHDFQRVAPSGCQSHVETEQNLDEITTELSTGLLWKNGRVGCTNSAGGQVRVPEALAGEVGVAS